MSLISYARFRKDKPDRKVQAAAVAQSYLALSCSIALWVLAPHFGNNVECNNQVLFVIFGSFPVFPAARILSLVVLPIITVVYTASLYYDYFHGSWRRGEKREPLIVPRTTSRSPLPPSENDQQSKKPRTDGSLLIHLVFIVVIFALLILNAELFLIRNFNGSQQKWGFGQVLPMFLISIPLIGVWEAFSKYGLSKHVSAD
ncbi:hypothetical protein BOTBODRAFT_34313 [Botryobasidium botryosum FD-172 SS1]|uniref:Uncharacterized protein n=1 Tax=Botryobasidium botryosum (strain FD-172 SS1) TaxID=930990 RepID=A0A067MCZ8_BOTB1|nr:hypothetical protein BOTBODRAFT_34313 [Botryobasidium botryosum FD-172 SS1]